MYTIYADSICIYDMSRNDKSYILVNPKLTLGDNVSGSLEFSVPPVNVGYNSIFRLTTTIRVYRDGYLYWEGRALSEEVDFWNNKKFLCEGAMSYFNDSVQPLNNYVEDIPTFLSLILDIHNAQVEDDRKIELGNVTVETDTPEYFVTNYEDTWTAIKSNLLEYLGGHIFIRYGADNKRYLDYISDYIDDGEEGQTIEFGQNLLSFTSGYDVTDFATRIIPLGKEIAYTDEDGNVYENDSKYQNDRLTIASVNGGKIYLQNDTAIESYGIITKVVDLSDYDVEEDEAKQPYTIEERATVIKELGEKYLTTYQFDQASIELSALDLNYANPDADPIRLLHYVRVVSEPHGMDTRFGVVKLEIPLDQPENCTFTLGGLTNRKSLTQQVSTENFNIYKEFRDNKRYTWSRFEKTEDKLESQIGSVEESVDGVSTQMATLTQTVDNFKTTVENQFESLGDTYYNKTEIDQKSDSIILSASSNCGNINLIQNKYIATQNTWIVDTTGGMEDKENFMTTDFIKIQGGKPYTFSRNGSSKVPVTMFSCAWYTMGENGRHDYISGFRDSRTPFTVYSPDNAAYIRVSFPVDVLPKMEAGTQWTPYREDGMDAQYSQAKIEVLSDSIKSVVTKDNVISVINQSAEAISISASKINLNGAVTANNYFKINTDGSIAASGGTIAGFTINGTRLQSTTNPNFYMDANPAQLALCTGAFAMAHDGTIVASGSAEFTNFKAGNLVALRGANNVYKGALSSTSADVLGVGNGFNKTKVGSYQCEMPDGTTFTDRTSYSLSPDVTASDRDAKFSIEELDESSKDFIMSLRPSKFKYSAGTSGRYHHGFIAQEVKESMGDDDWGVYVDIDPELVGRKGLRYEELIADMVKTIQIQHNEIDELKVLINKIQNGGLK